MFVCENCAPKAGVSELELMYVPQSYGPCEWCGETAICADAQRYQKKMPRCMKEEQMEKVYIEGCMWEDEAWIEFDSKISYSEPCKHCYGHELEEHTRHDGSTYTRAIWYCPKVVVVTNEGGCNSTGVCLDCVLEAAKSLGEPSDDGTFQARLTELWKKRP